jgi:hypothetical protein
MHSHTAAPSSSNETCHSAPTGQNAPGAGLWVAAAIAYGHGYPAAAVK